MPSMLRKVAVFLFGSIVLLTGIALIVLPGPAFLVIPLGLGILATEFLWAKRLLHQFKKRMSNAYDSIKNRERA